MLLQAVLMLAVAGNTTDGFHGGISAGAGFSYDGIAGLRAEFGYGPIEVALGLGRDTLPSTGPAPFDHPGTISSSFPHSFALSLRFVSGGRRGLVVSLTNWRQWEHTSHPDLPEPHLDDRFSVWQPAVGWRFAGDLFHFEVALGLPITSNHYFAISDEVPGEFGRIHRSGVGWTGCGHCDLEPLPSLEVGGGVHW